MNLYDRFKLKDPSDIFYYNYISYNPILRPSCAWNFIEEYFKLGGKEHAFDLSFFKELKVNGKHIHSISMYYIGCILSNLVKGRLNDKLVELIPGHGGDFKYKFIYSWFLTCLYHDTACVIEEPKKKGIKTGSPKWLLNEALKEYQIENNVYIYTLDIIENYFNYCRNYRDKLDHGIIGGFVFYDRLVKNYNKTWDKHKPNRLTTESYECFNTDNLSWRIEHLDHFAYIANSIIAHNIWVANKDTKKIYIRFGLDQLLEENYKKITLDEDPLVLFLAIVDTIEPTKFFIGANPEFVWKNIDMYYDSVENKINISVLSDTLDYKRWFKKISGLKDWLNVDISKAVGRNMEIYIL